VIPAPVADWLADNGAGEAVDTRPTGGGCISAARRVITDRGQEFFLKEHPGRALFAAEAEGLAAIATTRTVRVPEVLARGDGWLLLEYLPPAGPVAGAWEELGRDLARLHACTGDRFGFAHDGFCGATPQPNPWCEDGHEFYARHRFAHQARRARDAGLLDAATAVRVERLGERLPDLVPAQAPSLIHGDLWGGNLHFHGDGDPAVIDPAAHYGWPEAELAMTRMFGGYAPPFYAAYEEAGDIAPDWEDRVDLHNLYHVLNHLNLFGGAYRARAVATLDRYL